MRWEIEEIKRTILSKKMMIGFLISFGAMLYGGKYVMDSPHINFIDTFIFAQTDNTTAIIGLIFPILAVLPVGTSYRDEKSCGYYFLLKTKIKRSRYLNTKIIVSALSGVIVIGLPNLLFLIIVIAVKGIKITGESNVAISFLPKLYFSVPLLYACLLIVNVAICGAIFAILGMGISAWIKNKYIAMILPFAYYIFSGMVLYYINPWLNAISLFCVNQYQTFNGFAVLMHDLILLIGGILLFIVGVKYEDKC